jgi:hypothetical protein
LEQGAEVPEHAALDDALEFVPVVGLEMGGLMEAGIAARAVRECAIEDDTVVVEVRIERYSTAANPSLRNLSQSWFLFGRATSASI